MQRKAADEKKNAEKKFDEKRMYSIAPDMTGGIFPEISRMSDDELVTAAVVVRMALGETGKFSDRAVKVNTVNRLIRRLHPEYKSTDVGRESMHSETKARISYRYLCEPNRRDFLKVGFRVVLAFQVRAISNSTNGRNAKR